VKGGREGCVESSSFKTFLERKKDERERKTITKDTGCIDKKKERNTKNGRKPQKK